MFSEIYIIYNCKFTKLNVQIPVKSVHRNRNWNKNALPVPEPEFRSIYDGNTRHVLYQRPGIPCIHHILGNTKHTVDQSGYVLLCMREVVPTTLLKYIALFLLTETRFLGTSEALLLNSYSSIIPHLYYLYNNHLSNLKAFFIT